MDIGTIVGYACLGLLLWAVIRFTMNTWYHRMDGTGHDVDMDILGHRGARGGGDMELGTIQHVEKLLKDEAEKEQSDS